MSQDPESIRQDISETQARIGDTVEALAYKTDVPSRARDAVNDRVESIRGSVSDAVGSLTGAASAAKNKLADGVSAMPSPGDALDSLRSISARNPLGLAIGSVAVGFLIGLCLPVSDIERDRVGRLGEKMTEQAKNAASDALEQGKAAVTQAIGDAITGTTQPSH